MTATLAGHLQVISNYLDNIYVYTRWYSKGVLSGLIQDLHPASEKRRYKVTPSLIGWAQT